MKIKSWIAGNKWLHIHLLCWGLYSMKIINIKNFVITCYLLSTLQILYLSLCYIILRFCAIDILNCFMEYMFCPYIYMYKILLFCNNPPQNWTGQHHSIYHLHSLYKTSLVGHHQKQVHVHPVSPGHPW